MKNYGMSGFWKGLVTRITYVKYESPVYTFLEVMAKIKVFVYAEANPDTRGVTIALPKILPGKLKIASMWTV